jgi:PIN domain nuclease of toxin-antitoxin system
VILLDTNALLWLDAGHRRSRPLRRWSGRLHVSPVTMLELQILVELGRQGASGPVARLAHDERWAVDDPPAIAWFETALSLSWTRDPFDRLMVAHAQLRRWRVATGDRKLIERLGEAAIPL